MNEIALRPAHELAAAIARGDLSSRELLDVYLERIERLNPDDQRGRDARLRRESCPHGRRVRYIRISFIRVRG